MNEQIEAALNRVLNHEDVPAHETRRAMAELMGGRCSVVEIAVLLTALRVKGESVGEIVGAAQAMQEHATPITTERTGLLDTCGTGGDQLHTFNISTAAALLAAAVGVPVAKHGNRSVSSSSGSADVLEALGVNLQLTPDQVGRCLDEVGIGFCFAPLLHGAMKHAAPVRKQLRFHTVFNLLGPLTNPAAAAFQLLGANRPDMAKKLAYALARLGRRHAMVVCGAGELDEVSLWGETTVFEVAGGEVTEFFWTCETFDLPSCNVGQLKVNSPMESAHLIRNVFAGEQGPARDIILANTAAALMAAEYCVDPNAGVQVAAETIDSGKANDMCRSLVKFTNSI